MLKSTETCCEDLKLDHVAYGSFHGRHRDHDQEIVQAAFMLHRCKVSQGMWPANLGIDAAQMHQEL